MNELLVEWTLLREQDYLQSCLGVGLKRKLFQQYSTEYGRIDFAHEISGNKILITELETVIDSQAKLEYCQRQTLAYQKIKFQAGKQTSVAILAAEESSNKFKQLLDKFSKLHNILLKYYSLEIVRRHYYELIEQAVKVSGAPMSKPAANNFTHLSGLNRFILPFYERNIAELPRKVFIEYFGLTEEKADSHFKVYKQVAEYFDLIFDSSGAGSNSIYRLTDYGVRFRDGLNYEFVIQGSLKSTEVKRIDLSIEQQRILIESLINGNIGEKKGKVNILYFLRFLHLTEGTWIPRGRNLDKDKIEFANSFLGTDYSKITLSNWLNFVCKHCEELDLVERIKTEQKYDRAILTSLGSRVLGFIEMDLHLKREKIQIPLQV